MSHLSPKEERAIYEALNSFYAVSSRLNRLDGAALEFVKKRKFVDGLFAELCAYAELKVREQPDSNYKIVLEELRLLLFEPTDILPLVAQKLQEFDQNPQNLAGVKALLRPLSSAMEQSHAEWLGCRYASLEGAATPPYEGELRSFILNNASVIFEHPEAFFEAVSQQRKKLCSLEKDGKHRHLKSDGLPSEVGGGVEDRQGKRPGLKK
ncbi:MAG: hypothetical protein V1746_01835 [bacterium]